MAKTLFDRFREYSRLWIVCLNPSSSAWELSDSEPEAQQNHWSERGRATSIADSDALGRTRRSVLPFGDLTDGTQLVMLRVLKVRDVIDRLHDEGWRMARQRGSHRQFVHSDHPTRRVTVAGHPHLDLPKGTLNSIFKQAGWK